MCAVNNSYEISSQNMFTILEFFSGYMPTYTPVNLDIARNVTRNIYALRTFYLIYI